MTFLFIIIAIIIIIIIIYFFSDSNNKNIENYKSNLLKIGYQVKTIKSIYDLEIKKDDKTFLVKFISIPSYAEIQINNKYTYEIKYGAGSTPGKPQPYKKYLNNVNDFINYQTSNDTIKIFVATPKPKKIVKYINECEIIFVDYNTDVWGMRIISVDDFKIYKNIE